MKAIIEKNETYRITGEKGDFFVTENNKGKVKIFLKSSVEVLDIEEMTKTKVFKKIVITKEQAEKNHNRLVSQIHQSLTQETGRTGTIKFLKSI